MTDTRPRRPIATEPARPPRSRPVFRGMRRPRWTRRAAERLSRFHLPSVPAFLRRGTIDLRGSARDATLRGTAPATDRPRDIRQRSAPPVHPRIAQRRAEVAGTPPQMPSGPPSAKSAGGAVANAPGWRERVSWGRALRWGLLSVALVGTAAAGLLFSPLADLDELRVQGVTDEPAELVREASGLTPGTAMFGIRPRDVRDRLESLGWVAHADVSVRWPGTVSVAVTPERPVGVIVDGGSTTAPVLLTSSGELLDAESAGPLIGFAPALPDLELDPSDAAGLSTAVQVLEQLRSSTTVPLRSIALEGDSAVVLKLDPDLLPGSNPESASSTDTAPIEVDMGDSGDLPAKSLAVESVLSGAVERACMQRIDVSVPTRVTIRRTPGCTMPGGESDAEPEQNR